jgi:hypothetical protein
MADGRRAEDNSHPSLPCPRSWVRAADEGQGAHPLVVSANLVYGLQIAALDADAGYSTYRFVALLSALGISPVIDDNLRRRGKRCWRRRSPSISGRAWGYHAVSANAPSPF